MGGCCGDVSILLDAGGDNEFSIFCFCLFVEPLCLYGSIRPKIQARLEDSKAHSFARCIMGTARYTGIPRYGTAPFGTKPLYFTVLED